MPPYICVLTGHGTCDICGQSFDDLQALHDHRNGMISCGKKKHYNAVERYHVYNPSSFDEPRDVASSFGGESGGGSAGSKSCADTKKTTCLQGPLEFYFANWCALCGVRWTRPPSLPYTEESTGKLRRYYPDFYLPDHGLYIETKGKYTEANVAKMRRVLEAHPDKRICLILQRDFRRLYQGFCVQRHDLFAVFGMGPDGHHLHPT